MTENLMESVAPMLAPPVTRQPVAASGTDQSSDLGVAGITVGPFTIMFAADDDE